MATRVGSKWRSRRHGASTPRDDGWKARLEQLRAIRAPFRECTQRILSDLAREVLPKEGSLVEIGAGDGQLREWLPEDARWVYTEPSEAACRALRQRHPSARVVRGSAERLPFDAGSCAAIVGLCLLDLVDDVDAVFAEAHRILAPGGRLVHVLDLTPTHGVLFRELHAAGKIPLPNLFADPSEKRWPEDLLVTDRAPMQSLVAAAEAAGHPLSAVFGHYFERFSSDTLDVPRAVRAYDALSRSPEVRLLLKTTLLSAYELGHRQKLAPPRGVPTSSARCFSQRLNAAARRAGLHVVLDDVRAAWSHQARETGEGEQLMYRSLAIGHERRMNQLPQTPLCEDARLPSEPGMHLVESAAHVFVVVTSW